jgi:hypothetical protein
MSTSMSMSTSMGMSTSTSMRPDGAKRHTSRPKRHASRPKSIVRGRSPMAATGFRHVRSNQ